MNPGSHAPPSRDRLVDYLLGRLGPEETEQIDELSVADGEFASRLSAAEHDLVDAYVRGELTGEARSEFEACYLTAPSERAKVAFAEALMGYQAGTGARATPPRRLPATVMVRWAMAVAAALVLATGYLVVENRRLQSRVSESQANRIALEQRQRQLQQELDTRRSAEAEAQRALALTREALAQAGRGGQDAGQRVLAFVLTPALRGAGDPPVIAVPKGEPPITLRLVLESNDFPAYRASLQDSASGRTLWRSANLKAARRGDSAIVAAAVPAGLLAPGTYVMVVDGLSSGGTADFVDSYNVRVTVKQPAQR